MQYGEIIDKLTLEEKASLCVGKDYWNTTAIKRLNIPKITMSDGPHGLRIQKLKADNLGINKSEIATSFPTSATIASSWNKKVAYKLGDALGKEAIHWNVNILLGPAINMKRSPLCGRNFEYFAEDPYLAGKLGIEYVKGLQKNNVGACVKHFAVNNQEDKRRFINVVIDERTLREIYLKAFEMIVKEAKPWAVMSAYNKVNGDFCSENKILLDILKKEWKFDGIVITDWGANNDRISGIIAGNELEMPGGRTGAVQEIIDAVNEGRVSEETLNELVDRILKIAFKTLEKDNPDEYDMEKHHDIALKIAEESMVLLKNDDNILPIKNKKFALIGDLAKTPRFQGAGSSTINPYNLESAYDCLVEYGYEIDYAKGYERIVSDKDEDLLKEALEVAKRNDVVLIFAGLTENYESEGIDRKNLFLPENQNKLITEISKVNKNVIVSLSNGAPVVMPWKDKVKGIMCGYLGGESGERGVINCLVGKVNPSGKLAETYPLKLEDTPCYNNYPGSEVSVEYKEGIYVGYRYYDKNNLDVLFPFGYGLSYTKFKYSGLKIDVNKNVEVYFKIKNIGKIKGKEVAQVYVSQENPTIFKPVKELKGFEKIELNPGEEKTVHITLSKDAFEYYNVETKKWAVESGIYKILVGKSSRDIVLSKRIKVTSEDKKITKKYPEVYYNGNVKNVSDRNFEELLGFKIPNRNIDLSVITEENTLEQLRHTRVGKMVYDNQMDYMDRLLKEQHTNRAIKVMMNLQKPLKKFYERTGSKYTKEMIEEFIDIVQNDLEPKNSEFFKKFLK